MQSPFSFSLNARQKQSLKEAFGFTLKRRCDSSVKASRFKRKADAIQA